MTRRGQVPHITAAGARQWTLEHEHRPLPMNAYRKLHYHDRRKYDAGVRDAFGWLARQAAIPALEAVIVTAVPVLRTARSMPDVGACFPAVKAGIDGLVDAGVVPDDKPAYLRALTFVAPEKADRDALILLVEETTP